MSLIYNLLHGSQDDYFCNIINGFNERVDRYLKSTNATALPQENLKTGDIILYRQSAAWMHISLFVKQANGKSFVISKFGENHNVFIHPIDHVPDWYGEPVCFRMTTEPNVDAISKLEILKRELESCLPKLSNSAFDVSAVFWPEPIIPSFSSRPLTPLIVLMNMADDTLWKVRNGFSL